jgi:hypothetical protein
MALAEQSQSLKGIRRRTEFQVDAADSLASLGLLDLLVADLQVARRLLVSMIAPLTMHSHQ